jgi:hypothetical protein
MNTQVTSDRYFGLSIGELGDMAFKDINEYIFYRYSQEIVKEVGDAADRFKKEFRPSEEEIVAISLKLVELPLEVVRNMLESKLVLYKLIIFALKQIRSSS